MPSVCSPESRSSYTHTSTILTDLTGRTVSELTCICMMSDWSSESTEVTVLDTSWPFDEDTAAGVLDRLYDPPLPLGTLPNSLPPLGITRQYCTVG